MSGFDIDEASNYFLRYPIAQGDNTLQNTIVSGNLSISGNTTITNNTESTSTTTGAFIVSGGAGIAKNVYVGGNIRHDTTSGQTFYTRRLQITDISGTAPVSGEAAGEEYYVNGNTWVFENKGGNGTIQFQAKNASATDTKSMTISYNKIDIQQTTPATSTTTGALTVVGGISTQNNVYAGGNIIANGASTSVSIYSSTPAGATQTTNNGIILSSAYPGGIINEGNTVVSFGINTKHFGARNTTRAGGMVRLDSTEGATQVFSVLGQPAGAGANADPTTYFSIDSAGNALVYGNSASTSTINGALQVLGGVGVAGNVNVGDTIRVWDGVNNGGIDQSGTILQISSTGGNIALNGGNIAMIGNIAMSGGNIAMTGNVNVSGNLITAGTLSTNNILFADGTSQNTSISNNDIMSDCDFHTFVYNQANPSTPKTFITASYSLSQTPSSTTTALTANNLYFWPVYLTAGQTVNGVAFWVSAAVAASVAIFRGYDGITVASTRKTITAADITTGENVMTYANVNSWVVDWTGIHYVCILPKSNVSIVSTPTNVYANFGISGNLTGGALSRAGGTVAGTSIPATTSGTITTLTYIAYVGVYT